MFGKDCERRPRLRGGIWLKIIMFSSYLMVFKVSCTGLYADVYREPLTNDADIVVTQEFQKISELTSQGRKHMGKT